VALISSIASFGLQFLPLIIRSSVFSWSKTYLIILPTLPLEGNDLIIAKNHYFTFFITSDRLSQATVKSSFISFKLSPKTVTSPALTLYVN